MMFTKPLWLLGVAMTLESMRRGFVGGSALSLFVIKEFGLEGGAVPTINLMRGYLAIEEALLDEIPFYLAFLLLPFTDYHNASTCFLGILDELALKQRPVSCQYYWEKES